MVKRYLYDRQKMLNVLIVVSVLLFVFILATLITENAKFMGIGLTLFAITVFWNMRLMFIGSDITVGDLVNHIHKQEMEAKENKKYLERGIYKIVIPMVIVGLIFVVLILVAFFTIL